MFNNKVEKSPRLIKKHMAGMDGMILGALPVFDGKLFDDWRIKMLALFGFQDVAEVVTEGLAELGLKATDEEKKNYKVQQKLDSKARFLIYQCVNSKIFNKISKAATAKEAWGILIKTYGDGDKIKKVKLQTLRRQFEFLNMEESETISDYFDKIQEHVNAMRACNYSVSDQQVVDKILRTLLPRFDHVVVAIEENRDLDTMEIEELRHSLEAHEYRINERRRHTQEQAAQYNYKEKNKGGKKGNKQKHGHKSCDSEDTTKTKDHKSKTPSSGSKEWKFDKKKVRCYNCQKLGHFARDCWEGEEA